MNSFKRNLVLVIIISLSYTSVDSVIRRVKGYSNYTMDKFKDLLSKAKHVLVLTGAGVSAESGIPTFRGSDGFWRHFQAQNLATPSAFKKSPSLVWEFYHYRRELVLTKKPNKAHYAIAEFEQRCLNEGRKFTLVTQNVDGLHKLAGSQNIIELHGSIFKTKCMACGDVNSNFNSPICPALTDKGAPDSLTFAEIPIAELPRCEKDRCNGLLRPGVVWFGENLDPNVLEKAEEAIDTCDICIVIGTSSVVMPAAAFAPRIAERGVPVAELNLEFTPCTAFFEYHFLGPCTETVSKLLEVKKAKKSTKT